MQRLHVHIRVEDLEESVRFYTALFGEGPTVRKEDYAKWRLEDPRVNLALSRRCGAAAGIDHLGIEVDDGEELRQLAGRLAAAERPVLEQRKARCCYAVGDKAWVADPQGVAWETFHTTEEIATFGEDTVAVEALEGERG